MQMLTTPDTSADAIRCEPGRFNTAIATLLPAEGIAVPTLADSVSPPVTSSFPRLEPTTEKLGPFRRMPAYLSRRCGSIGVDR